MKKLISLLFAFATAASLSATAFACDSLADGCHTSAAAEATNWLLIGAIVLGVSFALLLTASVFALRTHIIKKKAKARAKAKIEARKAKKAKSLS
jgi:hypothetical protein